MHSENYFPLVSIILITYRDKNHLEKVLPLIKQNTKYPNYEIILIDNNNPENIENWIRTNYSDIKYYRLPRNLGFGRANNIGMKKAKGKYLVFLNTDTLPQTNWLNPLVQIAETDSQIGIVGCPCIPSYKMQEQYSVKVGQKRKAIEVPNVEGACFLYRKDLSEEESVGKFDRYLFFYSEDTDLSFRVWLHGYRVVLSSESIVYHNYKASNKKDTSDNKSRYFIRNYIYFLIKYEKWTKIFKELAILLLSLFSALIKRDSKRFLGKLKGLGDCLRKFKFSYSVRKDIINKFPYFEKTMYKIRKIQNKLGIYPNGKNHLELWKIGKTTSAK